MQDSPFDSFQSDIVRKLTTHKAPVSRYDKNHKTITVSYDFNYGDIPKIKLIASRERWLGLAGRLDKKIGYKTIAQILSARTRKGTRRVLAQYVREQPDEFYQDMLVCIGEANSVNPVFWNAKKEKLQHKKPRGGSPYGLSRSEMHRIRSTSRHLYVYIESLIKASRRHPPARLKWLFDHYAVPDDENKIRENAIEATRFIIGKVFNIKLDILTKEGIETDFYRNFINISGRPALKSLLKSEKIKSGQGFLLSKILSRFPSK